MPLPFIASLAPRIRALLPIIEGGVARGISSRNINQAIKDATGTGIKRQTLLDVMRRISGVNALSSQLRFLPKTAIPNINRLPVALTRLQRRLSFTIELRGTEVATGNPTTQFVTVTTDTALSREVLESIAEEDARETGRYEDIEITSAILIGGKRAGEAGTL